MTTTRESRMQETGRFYEVLRDDVTTGDEVFDAYYSGVFTSRTRAEDAATDAALCDASDGHTGRYIVRDETGLMRFEAKARAGYLFTMGNDDDLYRVDRNGEDLSEEHYQRRSRRLDKARLA